LFSAHVKKLETEGEAGFFHKSSRKGSNHPIVESARERIQELLDQGRSVNSIAGELGFAESTIRSKIEQGYLKKR
jgi:DNA-binding NarL/FixJ family response regulator